MNLLELGISNDNYSRVVNNAAALSTSWKILSDILLQPFVDNNYQEIFPGLLKNVLLKNLKKINTYRQDRLFEDLLWEAIECNKLKLREYDVAGDEMGYYKRNEIIGSYVINRENKIELVLSLSTALKEIKRFAPELNITVETLKNKLLAEGKIYINNTCRHKIAGHGIRGVLWIGEIPKHVFDIKENDPVEQTNQILEKETNKKPADENKKELVITTRYLKEVDDECPDFSELFK